MNNFLEKMQNLDEPMKRRVLAISTVLAMVVVVYVWIGYFNSILASNPNQLASQNQVAQGQSAAATQPTAQIGQTVGAPAQQPASLSPSSAPGFWQLLGGGFVSFYRGIANSFQGLGSSLQAPRQYDITPQQ